MLAAGMLADLPPYERCADLSLPASPDAIAPRANQPRRIGEILPEVLARYGLQEPPQRRRTQDRPKVRECQTSLW